MSYGFVLPVRCPISERVTTSTNQFWIKMCERSTVHGHGFLVGIDFSISQSPVRSRRDGMSRSSVFSLVLSFCQNGS